MKQKETERKKKQYKRNTSYFNFKPQNWFLDVSYIHNIQNSCDLNKFCKNKLRIFIKSI